MVDHNQFAVKQDEQGHTLMETMLSLMMFLAVISVIPNFYFVVFSTDNRTLHDQEVGLFFEQTDKEIQGSLSSDIQSNKLYLEQQNGTTITYENNGHRVIRKVDGKGFEIILQHVKKVEFTSSENAVMVTVKIGERQFTHQSILYHPFANQ